MRATVTASAVLLIAGPAWAAEGGGQPSIFTGDIGNIIWTLITFLAVVFVLGKFAWGPLLGALQKREKFIHDSLAQARKDRDEAQAKLEEIEKRLHTARDEASAIVDEGRRDADVVRRKTQQEARDEAEAILERARREIGVARDTALKQLYEESARLSTQIAGRILRKELDATAHDQLIRESIEELAEAADNGRNN